MELEEYKKINFLDLTIPRNNETLEFNIFRKPTYVDKIIPYNSCHPAEHKYATVRYLTKRINTYHLGPAAREDEMISIQNILHSNGFPLHHIDKSMAKYKHSKSKPAHSRENDKKWIAFTFFGKET
jgi:hypothetical protein